MIACIFDLDGVIVDTAHYHFLAWKRLAAELNYDFTIEENEKLKGVSRMDSLEILIQLSGITVTEEQKLAMAGKKNAWFNEYVAQMTADDTFPGARELITGLKNDGVKIGLASSSKNAKTVLRQLEMDKIFAAVVDGNMIAKTKPHPEIFLKAADMLGVESCRCVVVEDAEAGVEAALAAGMKCVGIGSQETLRRAHCVVAEISELTPAMIHDLML